MAIALGDTQARNSNRVSGSETKHASAVQHKREDTGETRREVAWPAANPSLTAVNTCRDQKVASCPTGAFCHGRSETRVSRERERHDATAAAPPPTKAAAKNVRPKKSTKAMVLTRHTERFRSHAAGQAWVSSDSGAKRWKHADPLHSSYLSERNGLLRPCRHGSSAKTTGRTDFW